MKKKNLEDHALKEFKMLVKNFESFKIILKFWLITVNATLGLVGGGGSWYGGKDDYIQKQHTRKLPKINVSN